METEMTNQEAPLSVDSEVIQEASVETAVKPKQYLLLADEMHRVLLGRLIPGILFVEVEGINMKDNDGYMLLANPVPRAVSVDNSNPPVQACTDEA